MQPRAIETRYKGYRFRSRLEARWAVFFDALGLKWEYEPEGFELGGGVRYLPDFRVHSPRGVMWFEVKPSVGGDASKAIKFGSLGKHQITVLCGPPDHTSYVCYSLDEGSPAEVCDWTGEALAAVEPSLNTDVIAFVDPDNKYGPWYFAWGTFAAGDLPDWFDGSETRQVARAIDAARGARFEHGENGAKR